MHALEPKSVGKISVLLILAVILNGSLQVKDVSAIELMKSLSMVSNLSGLLKQQDEQAAGKQEYASDDSLITAHAKSNKVSMALRYLHSKSGDVIYKRNGSKRGDEAKDPAAARALNDADENNLVMSAPVNQVDTRTDDQVIEDACKERPNRTCAYAVKTALRSRPEHKARIALALRRKPDYVDASKLLYHKLFESAISKVEDKGIDSKIDTSLGLIVDKTPYGFMANQALNMALKSAL